MAYFHHICFIQMARKFGKVKVLYTIPNFDTAGSGKALLKIAQRLDKKVFVPEILCKHDKGPYFQVVKVSGIPIHIYDYTTPMIPRFKGFKNSWRISRKFRAINPDLIHSFHYAPDYSEPLAAKMAGIPWIYTKKNMNWGGKSHNSWKLRTLLAKKVIMINSEMKEFLQEEKSILIHRGVDLSEFKKRNKDLKLLKELRIENNWKIILSVANLAPVKGIDILLKAFSSIIKKKPNLILVIVGEDNNSYGDSLKEITRNLGINSKVIFTGKRFDINRFFSISDLFVYPTKLEGEGFGLSLTEAMASGVISIGSDVPGIRDQLKGFENQMFRSGDPSDLANKTLSFLDLEGKEELKLNQQRNVIGKFSINQEVKKHELLYKEVVGN